MSEGEKVRRFVVMMNAIFGHAGVMPDGSAVRMDEHPEAEPIEAYVEREEFKRVVPYFFKDYDRYE